MCLNNKLHKLDQNVNVFHLLTLKSITQMCLNNNLHKLDQNVNDFHLKSLKPTPQMCLFFKSLFQILRRNKQNNTNSIMCKQTTRGQPFSRISANEFSSVKKITCKQEHSLLLNQAGNACCKLTIKLPVNVPMLPSAKMPAILNAKLPMKLPMNLPTQPPDCPQNSLQKCRQTCPEY